MRGLFSQTSSGGTTYQPQPNEICADSYGLLEPSDRIEAAFCGPMFTMLVSRHNAIISFGRNDWGMLGRGNRAKRCTVPERVSHFCEETTALKTMTTTTHHHHHHHHHSSSLALSASASSSSSFSLYHRPPPSRRLELCCGDKFCFGWQVEADPRWQQEEEDLGADYHGCFVEKSHQLSQSRSEEMGGRGGGGDDVASSSSPELPLLRESLDGLDDCTARWVMEDSVQSDAQQMQQYFGGSSGNFSHNSNSVDGVIVPDSTPPGFGKKSTNVRCVSLVCPSAAPLLPPVLFCVSHFSFLPDR
jgi:hypothetical protein